MSNNNMSLEDVFRIGFEKNGMTYQGAIDYSEDYWIVMATREDTNMDPFYSVNKKTFAVAHFSIGQDPSIIEKFKTQGKQGKIGSNK